MAEKALVIVESPAKAKTISKYLGDNYWIKSSMGHICDLPINNSINIKNIDFSSKEDKNLKRNERRVLIKRMGINPWNDWDAHYEVLPSKKKVVYELKQLAKKVDHIYLATDLDREGEAIAWHLQKIIGGDDKRYSRIVFNEITKNAIRTALKKPIKLNIDRVNAQQARRFIDRLVGYMISPLLWKKIANGLSAGRVQSAALRLVVERERKIKTFMPEEYWKIHADLATTTGQILPLQVTHQNNMSFRPKNRDQAMTVISLLEKKQYRVVKYENKTIINKPSAPFISSTLQQSASIYLGFSVKKTMMVAQELYETGYITYMRTDSVNLSRNAVDIAHNYIRRRFGEEYLPNSTYQYKRKKSSQEAHEAIRPTDITVVSEELKEMKTDAKELYKLIWCRFIACQMSSARYNSIVVTVSAGDFLLKAHGRVLCFDGHTKMMSMLRREKENEDRILPTIHINDELSLVKLSPTQHFTNPPARFSEASLVKELERLGIGRPSTYASIISTIQNRGYARVEGNRLYAEKIGEIVTDCLKKNFHELISYNFTAQMENSLDQVANHEVEWKKVLDTFFSNFSSQVDEAKKNPEEGGMESSRIVMTNINCPSCCRKMRICTSTTGVFLGCSGYILPMKDRCRRTINLSIEKKIFNYPEDNDIKIDILRTKYRCKKCVTTMDSYLIDSKRKLHICGNNPICDGYEIEEGEFSIESHDSQIIECEKCGHNMHLKMGRYGKYMACINDKCKNTRKILRNGEVAIPQEKPIHFPEFPCKASDTYFVLRNSAIGIFFAANTFPKSRETRVPLVEELYRFRDRLPEKFHYLADAPRQDPQGNKTVVRFNRKRKQQYIASEKEGKLTSWSAFFIDRKWVEWDR